MWKAADPKAAGYDFASVTIFDSLSDANNNNWEEIEGFFGKEKLEDLIRRTGDSRTVISSSIEQLVDYTTFVRSESDSSSSQALRYSAVTPKRPDATCLIFAEGLSPLGSGWKWAGSSL